MNTELLRRTMDRINGGSIWIQNNWCHCFAGNAIRESGSTPSAVGISNVRAAAKELLGLSEDDAAELFHATNTKPQLNRIVAQLISKQTTEDMKAAAEVVDSIFEPELVDA